MTIEDKLKSYKPTFATIDEKKLREEIETIDWESINNENRLEAIGCTLYELAADLEHQGYENTVAVLAAVMDGFRAHNLPRMDEGDGRTIANGFAQALLRAHIAARLDEEDETE